MWGLADHFQQLVSRGVLQYRVVGSLRQIDSPESRAECCIIFLQARMQKECAKNNQIRNIYMTSKNHVFGPHSKSRNKPLLFPYREKDPNLVKILKPTDKAKEELDEGMVKNSRVFRDLEMHMLMETRKHWLQI